MSEPLLTYHPNDDERTRHMPPSIGMGEVVVCTFPVYPSDDAEMPDQKRHALARMFTISPELLSAAQLVVSGWHRSPAETASAIIRLQQVVERFYDLAKHGGGRA